MQESGVDKTHAAGGQVDLVAQELTEQTGVAEITDVTGEAPAVAEKPRLEEAFAAKWSAKKDELREELRSEIRREFEKEAKPQQPAQEFSMPESLSETEIQSLADQLEVSPQQVRINYSIMRNQKILEHENARLKKEQFEESERREARKFADSARKKNPFLPEYNDTAVNEYRQKYHQERGLTLPWPEAYRLMVADMAVEGQLMQAAQQKLINQLTTRDKSSVQVEGPASQHSSSNIMDLSKEDFEKLKQKALRGELLQR